MGSERNVVARACDLWTTDRRLAEPNLTESRACGRGMREGAMSAATLRAVLVVGMLVADGSCNRFQEALVMNFDHTVRCLVVVAVQVWATGTQ